MRLVHVLMLLLAVSFVPACKGKKSSDDDDSDTVEDEIGSLLDEAKARVKDGKALTKAQYEKLMLQLSTCKVTDKGIDYKCPAYKTLRKASNIRTSLKDWSGSMRSLGKKHLAHAHPAVRIKAAGLMGSFFGSNKGTQQTVLSAIDKEKHVAVTVAMMSVVASSASKNPAVGKMLMTKVDDKSPLVRKKAISGLASSWAKGVKGRIPKLIDKMTKDSDMSVRKAACEAAGSIGDESLIPVYKKLTKASVDPALYSSCMSGLLDTWLDFPFYETHSKAGYKLTMKRLKKKPRDDKHPPWSMMSSFQYVGDKKSDKLKKWRAYADFYKKKDLIAVLSDIVTDEKANWMARTATVRSLAKLMKKSKFEKLLADCAQCNSHVLKQLKDELGKMK